MPGLTFDGEGLKVSNKSNISRSILKYGMTVSVSQIIKKDFSLECKVILLSIKAKILYHASTEESTSPHAIIKRRGKMWLLPKWINFSFIHLNKLRIIIIHFYKSQISENDIFSTITCYFIQYFISTVSF